VYVFYFSNGTIFKKKKKFKKAELRCDKSLIIPRHSLMNEHFVLKLNFRLISFPFSFHYVPAYRSCAPSWSLNPVYTFVYLLAVCLAPLLVMAFCYALIFRVNERFLSRIRLPRESSNQLLNIFKA